MSRAPTQPSGVPHAVEEDVTGVGRVPFRSDGEAQIYRDVRDLRKSHRALVIEVSGIKTGQARTEGKVDTLIAMQSRSKSPSNGVATALLADKLKTGAAWRGWVLRISAGIIIAAAGAYIHSRVG